MFAPARQLDPLRVVQGTRNHRYDCPDVATLERHITRLRHRIATVGSRSPQVASAWLTLPEAPAEFELRAAS